MTMWGTCALCGKRWQVKMNGELRFHRRAFGYEHCSGSGWFPVEGTVSYQKPDPETRLIRELIQ